MLAVVLTVFGYALWREMRCVTLRSMKAAFRILFHLTAFMLVVGFVCASHGATNKPVGVYLNHEAREINGITAIRTYLPELIVNQHHVAANFCEASQTNVFIEMYISGPTPDPPEIARLYAVLHLKNGVNLRTGFVQESERFLKASFTNQSAGMMSR